MKDNDELKKYTVVGRGLYKDTKGNTLLLSSDRKYLLKIATKQQALYGFLQNKLLLSLLLGFLVTYYSGILWLGIVSVPICYLVLEIIYRYWFLKKLLPARKLKNQVPKISYLAYLNSLGNSRLIKQAVLSLLVGLIFLYDLLSNTLTFNLNSIIKNNGELITKAISVIIITTTFAYSLLLLMIIIKHKSRR